MTQNFSSEIGYEPEIDFTNRTLIMNNGSPNMIINIDAVKQWIAKFVDTEKDVYPIYAGTNFGNRIKTLFGRKQIGYGYEESEIERDFREGLPLCPAISQVTNFALSKTGSVLKVDISVELIDGSILDLSGDNSITITL